MEGELPVARGGVPISMHGSSVLNRPSHPATICRDGATRVFADQAGIRGGGEGGGGSEGGTPPMVAPRDLIYG